MVELGFFGTALIILAVIVIGIAYIILSKKRDKVKETYSLMNDGLKKRWDMIPTLVEALTGSEEVEEEKLQKIVALQNQDYTKFVILQKLEIDDNISKVATKMIQIAEDYPELQSNEQYINLKNQLVNLEKEITTSKKEYKDAVRKYNDNIERVPLNIIAILFGFNEETEI